MNDRDLDRDLEEIAKQTKELERQLAETKAIQQQIKEKHFSEILRKLGSDASKAAEELEGENSVSLLLLAADELAGEESLLGFHSAPLKARLEMELDHPRQSKTGQKTLFRGGPQLQRTSRLHLDKPAGGRSKSRRKSAKVPVGLPFKESFSSLRSVTKSSREKLSSTQ